MINNQKVTKVTLFNIFYVHFSLNHSEQNTYIQPEIKKATTGVTFVTFNSGMTYIVLIHSKNFSIV